MNRDQQKKIYSLENSRCLSHSMGQRLLFDLEADGLREEVGQVWCIIALDLTTGLMKKFKPHQIEKGIKYLQAADTLVGHNILGYDLPVLSDLYGEWPKYPKIVDTFITSALLQPERAWGHGLRSWGIHLGIHKGDFNEWGEYSQEMLDYCEQDVLVNEQVLYALEEEYGKAFESGFSVY